MEPLQIAIIGLGGFAGSHHSAVRGLEAEGKCRLICTCDPNPAAFEQQMRDWDFAGRGVRVFDNYVSMLDGCASELDAVTIATPVPLHSEMHRACVERGLPVYLEKPPTLDWRELEEMIAADQSASKLTHVGFNFIDDPVRHVLKQRILEGEFGDILKIGLKCAAPRPRSYYKRASWAARLMMDGRLVLDSCMGNAMAHLVHNVLFWGGEGQVLSWAPIRSAKAELYRAHDIEGIDTVFTSAVLESGAKLDLALTHACEGQYPTLEWLVCEKATIRYVIGGEYSIDWNDGRAESGPAGKQNWLAYNMAGYLDYVRGVRKRPVNRLEDCRPFVHLCDLVYVAAGHITTVLPDDLEITPAGGSEYVAIRGIKPAIDRFSEAGEFPSEQGLSWAAPGGQANIDDLSSLREIVAEMRAERVGV